MSNWFYEHENKQFGPVSSQELKQFAASGRLCSSDLIWQEGTNKKYQAKQAKGLFPPIATSVDGPPPLPPVIAKPPRQQWQGNTTVGGNGQSPTPAALKQRIEELRQSIVQQVINGQADLPAVEPIASFRREYSRLQEQLGQLQSKIQQIVQAKTEYEQLENAWNQKNKELATIEACLTQFNRPLGKSAFQGFMLGQVPHQPIFNECMAVHRRVAELRAEHDRLNVPANAGLFDKTKAKTQQLVVAGQIKLEEMKFGKLEGQIGKELLGSNQENSVHCDLTAPTLAEIANRRAIITGLRRESEQARENLMKKQKELCQSLLVDGFNGSKSFDMERQKCLVQIAEIENRRNVLAGELPEKLLAVESILSQSPLAGNLRFLRDAQAQLAMTPTSDPTPPLPPDAFPQSPSGALPSASQDSFWDVTRGLLKSDRKNLSAATQRFKKHPIGRIIAGVCSLLFLLIICGKFYVAFNGKSSHPSGAASTAESTVPARNSMPTESASKKVSEQPSSQSPRQSPAVLPSDGRELKVTVRTPGYVPDHPITLINKSLRSVKCYATSDELVIDLLDVGGTQWRGNQNDGGIRAILVRLFDRNGNYLTHFTTTEGFTLDPRYCKIFLERYKGFVAGGDLVDGNGHPFRKPTLLQRTGNRFRYKVNVRDLRDAAIVELGFIDIGE